MTTSIVKGRIVFTCDDCDDTLEPDTADFTEANQARKDEGWAARQLDRGAGWTHYCPTCKP